jgi:hypothetical protein
MKILAQAIIRVFTLYFIILLTNHYFHSKYNIGDKNYGQGISGFVMQLFHVTAICQLGWECN